MHDAHSLPKELDACHLLLDERAALIAQQSGLIAELSARIEELAKKGFNSQREIEELQLLIRKLLQGNRREKFIDPRQLVLDFPDDPELQEALRQARVEAGKITETITYERELRRKPKPRQESFPPHLRRVVTDVEGTEEDRVCAEHGPRAAIRHDEVESLCYTRPEIWIKVQRYPVYACPGKPECGIASPERPIGICEGNRYDPSVAVAVVNYKFAFHLPYYRQQDLFAGSGWCPSRSTLDNLMNGVDFVLEPLADLLRTEVLAGLAVGLDDTHVTLLMPSAIPEASADDLKTRRLIEKMREAQANKQPSLNAKMWVYSGLEDRPYNVFDFRVSRHRDGPLEFLADYDGYVMADCYSGNLSVVLAPSSAMTRMACWSHGRRHMYDARLNFPNETAYPLALMGQLYDIERRALEYSAIERGALRLRESVPILEHLRKWLAGPIALDALPKSGFGGAVNYLRNHWEPLLVYTRDGRLPMDNNFVERLMKQIATGRKNWIFIGSVRAGERNARLLSLVSSAHRHDLDVEMYLNDVTRRILSGSTDYRSMLPDVWKGSHPEAVRAYRAEERRDKADQARLEAANRRRRLAATT